MVLIDTSLTVILITKYRRLLFKVLSWCFTMNLMDDASNIETQSTVDTEDDKNEKGDLRVVPKGILKQFIDTYRAHPALWQVKNKEVYTKRNLKNRGYLDLVKVWKNFDPQADQKMVKCKIQSLRGSFRKELKKVEKSERSGKGVDEVYKSTLWYFQSMMFLNDHELPAESIDNIDAPSPSISNINTVVVPEPVEEISESGSIENSVEAEMMYVDSAVTTGKKRYQNIDYYINPQKRQKISEEHQRKMFMAQCTEVLTAKVTDTEALAQYLSLKLEKISNPEQKMYAEALLTKVINRAILNKLTEATDLTELNILQMPNYYTYPPSVTSTSSCSNTSHYTITPLTSPVPVTVPDTHSASQAHSASQEPNASQESHDVSNDGVPEMISVALQQLYADIDKEV